MAYIVTVEETVYSVYVVGDEQAKDETNAAYLVRTAQVPVLVRRARENDEFVDYVEGTVERATNKVFEGVELNMAADETLYEPNR